jgi:hypothetical protein
MQAEVSLQSTHFDFCPFLIQAGSCLNMRMCRPHVEDDAAQNHYEVLWVLEMMLGIPVNYYGVWA